jgi:hypothetical protein
MEESKDVISFTFTSPLRKKMSKSRKIKVYPEKLSSSPTRLNVIDVDELSLMLSHINPPQCTLETEGCSVGFKSISEDRFDSMVCNSSREHDNSFHLNLLSDKLDIMDDNFCSSSDNMMLNMNQQFQVSLSLLL